MASFTCPSRLILGERHRITTMFVIGSGVQRCKTIRAHRRRSNRWRRRDRSPIWNCSRLRLSVNSWLSNAISRCIGNCWVRLNGLCRLLAHLSVSVLCCSWLQHLYVPRNAGHNRTLLHNGGLQPLSHCQKIDISPSYNLDDGIESGPSVTYLGRLLSCKCASRQASITQISSTTWTTRSPLHRCGTCSSLIVDFRFSTSCNSWVLASTNSWIEINHDIFQYLDWVLSVFTDQKKQRGLLATTSQTPS